MTKLFALSALPAFALLAACGGGNDTVVTNDTAIFNDTQSNYTGFDDPMAMNETAPTMAEPDMGNMTGNSTAYGSNEAMPQ